MTGLASSFLTAFCIYPYLKMPVESKRRFLFRIKTPSLPRPARLAITAGLALAALIILAFNASQLKVKNDISALYTMSASLLESEKRTAQVLNHGSSGWYFIIAGSSPAETLENEERLTARLEKEVALGNLGAFMATSVFVPSIKTQKKTYEAMKALIPLVPSQFEYLGFPIEYAESFYKEFDTTLYCLPEDAPSFAGVSNLWIGNQGGKCYSCVLPLHPAADESVFRAIAKDFYFAHFVNKGKDIGSDLDVLTKTMLVFFLAACVVISILIFCAYPRRESIKICAAPLFLALVPMAVLALNKTPPQFFSVAALILVLGLGMDYVFYMTGKKSPDARLALLAVTASFLTTLLSFGALALSSFIPAHIFGLTVSAGLSGAFIFAMLVQGKET
jgi:predicted exporter